MLTTILWDNDGVLVDTERLFFEANREMLAAHRLPLSEADFFAWFLLDNRGAWHLLRERGYSEDACRELRAARDRRYAETLAARADLAIDGMAQVLGALVPVARMGLVTSAKRVHLEAMHRHTGFLAHFATIVSDEDCETSKPSPEPYLTAMARLGVSPSECIAVEDSPRGLAAARAAGLPCIVRRSALTHGHDFAAAGACSVVETSRELQAELERRLAARA